VRPPSRGPPQPHEAPALPVLRLCVFVLGVGLACSPLSTRARLSAALARDMASKRKSDELEGGARKSSRSTDAEAADLGIASGAKRQPRTLRVKMAGSSTCTRQLQVREPHPNQHCVPMRARFRSKLPLPHGGAS
jgi:hypothetical protein